MSGNAVDADEHPWAKAVVAEGALSICQVSGLPPAANFPLMSVVPSTDNQWLCCLHWASLMR